MSMSQALVFFLCRNSDCDYMGLYTMYIHVTMNAWVNQFSFIYSIIL